MKLNLNQEVNKDTFNLLYVEYKAYLAPACAILVSIILFLFFLVPQFFSLSAKRNTANSENQKLDELVEAKNIAASMDLTQLASNLTLANFVLPSSKDFESIINSISTAAVQSNTVVQDYQFQDAALVPGSQLGGFPSLTFTVNLISTPTQTMDFIKGLYEKAPVSEVESITQSESGASLTIQFFYKPFAPVTDTSNIKIRKMNNVEVNTLNKISEWNIGTFEPVNLPESPSSGSAEENNSPF